MRETDDDYNLPREHEPRRRSLLVRGVAYLSIVGIILALIIYSPIFTLEGLIVHGKHKLTETELYELARLKPGQRLFELRTEEVTQNLLRDLRIESAVVKRSLPNKLELDIIERMPIITVACDYGYLDFDRQGKVIASYKVFRGEKIPLLTGVNVRDLYIGDDNYNPHITKILNFLSLIDAPLLSQISEVNMANLDSITAYTNTRLPIKLGAVDSLESKAVLMQDFLQDQQTTKHTVEYADFSYAVPFIKLKNIQLVEDDRSAADKQ